MYHHVAPPDRRPASPDPREGWEFTHTPESFGRHLTELRRRGRVFIPLPEYVDAIERTGRPPRRAVAITFDDGWLDNAEFATPILMSHNAPATFFVMTGADAPGPPERRMSVETWRDLRRAGMTLGAHTRSHSDLTRLTPAAARGEIEGSRDDLARELGEAPEFFAYPGGAFNRSVAALVREAGFRAACGVFGPAENDRESLYWLRRDTLSESMKSWRDRYRLSPVARRALRWRVARREREALNTIPAAICAPTEAGAPAR